MRNPHRGFRFLHLNPPTIHQFPHLLKVRVLISGRADNDPFDWQVLAQVIEQRYIRNETRAPAAVMKRVG